MHGLYAAIATSSDPGMLLTPSRHGAALDLLALLYATAAAFLALSLLDAHPAKDGRQRWIRRVLAALPLGLAVLLVNWIGFAAVGAAPIAPGPALFAVFAGALVSVTALDQRQRGHGFYFLASLPLTLGCAFAHRVWLQQVGGVGFDQAGPAVALVYLLAAVGLGFVLATYFRRRRTGSPLFLSAVASLLIGIGLLTHHLSRLVAVHSIASRQAEFDPAQLGVLLLLGLCLLVGGVYMMAQRRRLRGEASTTTTLRQSARVEPVTGLPTLDVLAESFVRVLRLAVAAKGNCALAVLHFAGLDRIQSTQGRSERDRLYSLAAWRLRTVRRDEELIGAMGDNRFVLVLRVGDASEATQRVRELVALFDNPLGEGEGRVRLRPSAGVSLWPSHGDDFSRLLANALVALERCPPGGLQLFHVTQREENEHRLRVESNLSTAIAQGELGLVLQPLVDALSGEVRLVELLARWNNSDLGNVSPRQFILIAESSGVIGEFDRWLLREAISTTKWLDAAGFIDIRVALNCSPVNLADEGFLDFFEKTVRESGINPARIEVEVTEAALAEGERAIIDSLLRLRALGVGLTIDDFGIGHSSLARLRDLPVDSLKIDQSFIRDMDHPKGEFLVSGILGLAHGLGKAVIAEGVETEAQRVALTELGCEYLQGYLISKPLSWRGLLDFLGSNAGGSGIEGDLGGDRGRRDGDSAPRTPAG